MKRFRAYVLVAAVLALIPGGLWAETGTRTPPRLVSRPGLGGLMQQGQRVGQATAAGYSVQLNIVTRVTGLALYRTAVDITNNTSTDGVAATFQYCYTLGGVFQGCTDAASINLGFYDNFHTDDILQYLGDQHILPQPAADNSFGTFIVTFDGLPSNNGWEGTVLGRTYSAIDALNPLNGVVQIAYPASLFFESSKGTLVATIRDTKANPTDAGQLRTNIGVTNTALYNNIDPVDVQLQFFNAATGTAYPTTLVPDHPLAPGEVFQFSDVFKKVGIPGDVDSVIVFIDIISSQPANPLTIEGYVDVLDGHTQDGAYYEFKCSVGCQTFD